MSDLDPVSGTGYALGTAGAVKLVWDFVAARMKRANELEQENSAEEKADIKKVLELSQEMKTELGLIKQSLATQKGEFDGLNQRVEGISTNYGGRISKVEQDVSAILAKLELLLGKRARK